MSDYGLEELSADWGMEVEEMLKQSVFDGISPAICVNCGYTVEMEPDQSRGWCEVCKTNTVKSACVLAGII